MNIEEYIKLLNEEEKKEIFLSLREANRSINYGLDTELSVYFLKIYLEYIKTKQTLKQHVDTLNAHTKIYEYLLLLITFSLLFLLYVF